jgi:hypothetical protein
MKVIFRSMLTAALFSTPTAALWAQNSNPGNSAGVNATVATPTFGNEQDSNPALTTGSRYSVKGNIPAYENPTVAGATGSTIVRGDRSSISLDRRATIQQKTGGAASDAPG